MLWILVELLRSKTGERRNIVEKQKSPLESQRNNWSVNLFHAVESFSVHNNEICYYCMIETLQYSLIIIKIYIFVHENFLFYKRLERL